jgi:hypothetical protein
MGNPTETLDQPLNVNVQHAPETLAKPTRKLSTPDLLELEALVARQEAILDGPRNFSGTSSGTSSSGARAGRSGRGRAA